MDGLFSPTIPAAVLEAAMERAAQSAAWQAILAELPNPEALVWESVILQGIVRAALKGALNG